MPISTAGTCHANPESIVEALNKLADLVKEQNSLLIKLLDKNEGVYKFNTNPGEGEQTIEGGNTEPNAGTAPSSLKF